MLKLPICEIFLDSCIYASTAELQWKHPAVTILCHNLAQIHICHHSAEPNICHHLAKPPAEMQTEPWLSSCLCYILLQDGKGPTSYLCLCLPPAELCEIVWNSFCEWKVKMRACRYPDMTGPNTTSNRYYDYSVLTRYYDYYADMPDIMTTLQTRFYDYFEHQILWQLCTHKI